MTAEFGGTSAVKRRTSKHEHAPRKITCMSQQSDSLASARVHATRAGLMIQRSVGPIMKT